MHDVDYANVRVPVLVQRELGTVGWKLLHDLAELRGRPARTQVVALLRWALWRASQGDDTEPTHAQLVELGIVAPLELVS